MNGALQIAVDLEQGEVRLGTERVRLLPAADDVFYLNDLRGPMVRALRFEERSLLLADAADGDVALRIADAAFVASGEGPDAIRIAASLALAGGGEDAPSFSQCAQFVEEKHGWNADRVARTMALVIDKLCAEIDVREQSSSGWKQIVFQPDVETLITQMVTNLAQRAGASSARDANSEPDKPLSRNNNHHPSESRSRRESPPSVSSVLPVNRTRARVLSLNTDHSPSKPTILPPAVARTDFPDPIIALSKTDHTETPSTVRQAPTSTTTIPVAPQATNFSSLPLPQSNHTDFSPSPLLQTNRTNFSLSQTAPATCEPLLAALPPVATFPAWQPFAPTSPTARPVKTTSEPARTVHTTSEPARTVSHTSTVAESQPSMTDWLAELALLLEAECDMRGIDP